MKLDKLYFCGFNEPVARAEKREKRWKICLCNLLPRILLLHKPEKKKQID